MKKILIGIGYTGAAFVFALFIYAGISNPWAWSEYWLSQTAVPIVLGLCGFGAFFLKKPYRMPAVLFIFWLLGLLLALTCFPPKLHFFYPTTWGYGFDTAQNRHDFFNALFYTLWCFFGMAQAFIKQPPRDTIIIIHSTLSVLIYGIWRLFIR